MVGPSKVVVLVLDGLGVGEMPDVSIGRPQDKGANTLKSLAENVSRLSVDNLVRLGLGNIVSLKRFVHAVPSPLASFGRCRLAHTGADSYLGHQEIMGTIPKPPVLTLMNQAADRLEKELTAAGHLVTRPLAGKSLLLVDDAVVIGDNVEADPGLNINATVATDWIDFDRALEIGRIVRRSVSVGRVIVFGGPGITTDDVLKHVVERENGQVGIDSPALGVYNDRLCIQHMGYGVDPEQQAPSILSRMGINVALFGKMADLVVCPGATKNPIVPTPRLMEAVLDCCRRVDRGLIAATVQETDLAAHAGDLCRLASVLEQADRGIGALLAEIAEGDVLIVCADHGNDPRLNIGLHTREETPLLVYQKARRGSALGVRDTMADIGATAAHVFGAPSTRDGSIMLNGRNT